MLKGNCDGVMAAGIDALLGGHVPNGSKADIRSKKGDVPESGHPASAPISPRHRAEARQKPFMLLALSSAADP